MSEELLKNLEKAHEGIKSVQEKVNEQGEKLDAIDQEYIKKAGEDAAKALEAIQKANSEEKLKEMQDQMDEMQKSVIASLRGNDVEEVEYKHDLAKYLKKGVLPDENLVKENVMNYLQKHTHGASENEIDMLAKDLLAGSNPDGGFFLTTDRSSRVMERIFETSPLRGVANVETTAGDVFEMILDDDEASSGWVGEVSDRPDTNTPQVGLLKIPVHEIYAQPRATQKILDDAGFDVEGWLQRKVARKIGREENTAFVTGDGSQKPKGFLSYDAWASEGVYERGKVEQINSGSNGSFGADSLIGLQNSLFEEYQANGTFGMKRNTFTDVMQLKGGDGQYLLNPMMLSQGSDKILLGSNVVFMDDMPAVDTDALAVVYADFSEFYTIVDRFDIRVLRDPYTAKPYVKFYTTKRTGGAVTNYEAGKILKLSA